MTSTKEFNDRASAAVHRQREAQLERQRLARLPVFEDLVDLAESGLTEGRVKDTYFGRGKVWYQVDVEANPDVPGSRDTVVFVSNSTSWTYEVELLLHDERLRKSIKMTAAMRTLPKIEGTVTVSFKHEDVQRGQAVGPVTVIDQAVYTADPEVTKSREGNTAFIPHGYVPQGSHQLGWQTLAFAEKVARHYGVSLEEW